MWPAAKASPLPPRGFIASLRRKRGATGGGLEIQRGSRDLVRKEFNLFSNVWTFTAYPAEFRIEEWEAGTVTDLESEREITAGI